MIEIDNQYFPYFVYGSLKPGEIAYHQISDVIEKFEQAQLKDYSLFVRDGAPVIFNTPNSLPVEGFLIWPKKNLFNQFRTKIEEYEGTRLYLLERVQVKSESSLTDCFTHVGRNRGLSHAEPLHKPWTSADDPIFSQAFPNLFAEIKQVVKNDISPGPDIEDWKHYNDITSKYLLLITVVERLAYLYCGEKFTTEETVNGKTFYNDRIMKRLTTLGKTQEFVSSYEYVQGRVGIAHLKIYDSRDAKKSIDTRKPKEALDAWYQVRSNLQHRGKSAWKDVQIVQDSLIDLANITKVLLTTLIPTIEETKYFELFNLEVLISNRSL